MLLFSSPYGIDVSRVLPSSAPDPGAIYNDVNNIAHTTTYVDVSGKTARSTSINPAEKTLVLITAGQSLGTDNITDTFTPTNGSKLDNYLWVNGTIWAATTPLVGTSWNGTVGTSVNFNHKVADGIISNGKFDRVIIVPTNMAGTTVSYWAAEATAPPSGFYRLILAAAKKLAAQGITPATPGVKFLVKWNQGEADTLVSTSQASYTADFNKLMALCANDLPGVKWMVAKESWYIGSVSTNVQNAQLALVDNVTVFAGENMDSLDATNRIGDNTHLNATGGNAAAAMGIAAITAITF
jgi:hypothetical protein